MSARLFALGSLGVMLVAIGTAWAFQIVGGFVPCALCLEQRVPYYLAIPLALAGLLLASGWVARGLFIAAAAAMVWGAGLGIYHAGAEWSFWPGPATCGGGGEVTDAANLLAAIEQTRLVSCTEATGRLLGLSFAGWNVLAASLAAVLLVAASAAPPRPAR